MLTLIDKKITYIFIFLFFFPQDRVSITINTLVESSNEESKRLEFEMRTVKDLPLSELIPNQAAQNAIRQAGKRIDMNEEGPIEFKEKTPPCRCLPTFAGDLIKSICCFGRQRKSGGVQCCCLPCPKMDNMCCGTMESQYWHCDPIIRLHSNESDVKLILYWNNLFFVVVVVLLFEILFALRNHRMSILTSRHPRCSMVPLFCFLFFSFFLLFDCFTPGPNKKIYYRSNQKYFK